MKKLNLIILTLTFLFVLPLSISFAQKSDEMALKIAEVQKQNFEALKNYSWKRKIDITNGENETSLLQQVRFNTSGEMDVSNLSSDTNVKKKSGPVAKSKQKKGIEANMGLVEAAIGQSMQYIFMSKGALLDYMDGADIKKGVSVVVVDKKGVLNEEDQVTTEYEKESLLVKIMDIKTLVEGKQTIVKIVMKQLDDGTNRPLTIDYTFPEVNNMNVHLENFDYMKQQ